MNEELKTLDSRRILIVEDEEGLAIHLSFLLKRLNYHALNPVAYGEEAVDLAGKQHPDLILMDINLAGPMNGIEAARLVRERYDIPVIFLSALSEEITIRDAQGSQPYAYLVKPVKEVELRVSVEMAIYKHKMEARLQESEQRYRLLFEKMSNGLALGEILFDSQGRPTEFIFLAVNPAFKWMTGVGTDDWVGHNLREVLPDYNSEYLTSVLGRVAISGESAQFDYNLPGTNRFINITAYSPKPGQAAMIAEDITDRLRAEQSLRKSEEDLRESYHRLEHSLGRMNILRNIDQAITTHTDYSSMANAILSEVVAPGEADAVVLFVPNPPVSGRVRGTGPLSMLRLAGLAGLPESVVDSSVLNWQTILANQVFQSCQMIFINNLHMENHPGADQLQRMAGFNICAVLPLVARGQVKGVLQFFLRNIVKADEDWQIFLQSLALQTAIGIDHVEMLENLKRSNRELALAYDETIKGWALALELREKEDRGHAERVSELSVRLASAMGMRGQDLDNIRRGAFLHDIGKMAVPDSLLYKTGPLSSEEWVTMRQHPTKGYQLLSAIEYLKPALDVVYCHHERWDGSGYPRGLKGEEIPLAARIFTVIDVWDALTNNRTYRLAWPTHEVRAYLQGHSGTYFDSRIIDVFLRMV